MRPERNLPIKESPDSGFTIRALDVDGKSVRIPFTSLIRNSNYGGFVAANYNPGTPDGYIFYVCSESGNYVNFGMSASKFDQFHWNTNSESWDFIPYSEGIEYDKRADGGKWVTYGDILKLLYWTGSEWAETGTEVPLPSYVSGTGGGDDTDLGGGTGI